MNNAALWMKPETRNQKPETRNQKPISAFPRLCVKRSMLALACAGLSAVAASAGEAAVPMSSPDTNPYITFSSSLKFYVWPQKSSDGTLEYSDNAKQWLTNTTANMEAVGDSGVYKLYVRGTGNTRITADSPPPRLANHRR
ncbi:MAG TPA: hypothetical protein PLJ32_06090 [Kiritimatiellia bacterium]|jgi:hypothetical protein|nr:hypothetical protein [Kiritimatiellia bacterium]